MNVIQPYLQEIQKEYDTEICIKIFIKNLKESFGFPVMAMVWLIGFRKTIAEWPVSDLAGR